MVLLHRAYGNQFRFEDVDVQNRSSALPYPRGSFDPCMLISSDDRKTIILSSGIYLRAWGMDLPQEESHRQRHAERSEDAP